MKKHCTLLISLKIPTPKKSGKRRPSTFFTDSSQTLHRLSIASPSTFAMEGVTLTSRTRQPFATRARRRVQGRKFSPPQPGFARATWASRVPKIRKTHHQCVVMAYGQETMQERKKNEQERTRTNKNMEDKRESAQETWTTTEQPMPSNNPPSPPYRFGPNRPI